MFLIHCLILMSCEGKWESFRVIKKVICTVQIQFIFTLYSYSNVLKKLQLQRYTVGSARPCNYDNKWISIKKFCVLAVCTVGISKTVLLLYLYYKKH